MIRKFFAFCGATLTLMLFSFLLIMGSEEKPPQVATQPLNAAGLLSSRDLPLLAGQMDVSIPYLSSVGAGQVEDIPFGAGYAHLLTWTDENNLTVRCIRPAAAALLLRSDACVPTGESVVIDGMTAVICSDGQTVELHYGDELAAYCLSLRGTAQMLFDIANQLQFTH